MEFPPGRTRCHDHLVGCSRESHRLWTGGTAISDAEVEAIVEQVDLTPKQESLREINSGIYAFKTAALLAHLDNLTANNGGGRFYLTEMAALLRAADERVVAVKAAEAAEVLGANTLADLASLDATMRAATASRLMAAGVTIFRPDSGVIDAAQIEAEADTIIEPFVQLLAARRLARNATSAPIP